MTTVIPKDCLLCDVCNDQLVDENGEVLQPFMWTDWGLVCGRQVSRMKPIQCFQKGDSIPHDHILWAPLVIV